MKNYSSVLIIYNPNAMKGKIDDFIPKIKERLLLRYSQVDAVFSPETNGAEALALKLAPKYDIVVSCGGDGTLHQVVNGVMKSNSNPLIGILPFGTCNDVARTLKIPFDADKAIDCILRLNTQNYDLMYDGQDYITYSLATGYLVKSTYSSTNESKKKLGRFAYIKEALKSYKGVKKLKTYKATIVTDNEIIKDDFIYGSITNSISIGGFKWFKRNDFKINDGLLEIILIKKPKNFRGVLKIIYSILRKKYDQKNIFYMKSKHMKIDFEKPVEWTLDGEYGETCKEILIENNKNKIGLLLPKKI